MLQIPPSSLVAIAPLIGLTGHTLSHLILVRTLRSASPYPSLALSALFNVGTTLGISLNATAALTLPSPDAAALVALNALASLALAFCYFNFVNLMVASLRLRLLEELLQSSPQSTANLLTRYNSQTVFELRLRRLLASRHLVEIAGRIFSGRNTFLLVARIFDFLRWAILGMRPPAEDRPPSAPKN